MAKCSIRKIKKTALSNIISDSDFYNIFNNVPTNFNVITEKNIKLRANIKKVINILFTISKHPMVKQVSNYTFITDLCSELIVDFKKCKDFNETVKSEDYILAKYSEIKDSCALATALNIGNNITKHEELFTNTLSYISNLSHYDSIYPLKGIPFKPNYDKLMKADKKSILTHLNDLMHVTTDIYKTLILIDLKLDNIGNVIAGAMESFKSIPELRDCDDMFKLLSESGLNFQENIQKYYTDYVISGNNGASFITNFIADVIEQQKDSDGSVDTIRKLQKLIKFIKAKINDNGQLVNGKKTSTQKNIGKHIKILDSFMTKITNAEVDGSIDFTLVNGEFEFSDSDSDSESDFNLK
jgi:hypothetical protein